MYCFDTMTASCIQGKSGQSSKPKHHPKPLRIKLLDEINATQSKKATSEKSTRALTVRRYTLVWQAHGFTCSLRTIEQDTVALSSHPCELSHQVVGSRQRIFVECVLNNSSTSESCHGSENNNKNALRQEPSAMMLYDSNHTRRQNLMIRSEWF